MIGRFWFRRLLPIFGLSLGLALGVAGCGGDEISQLPEARGTAGGAPLRVLLIDDDEALPGTPSWEAELSTLGVLYDLEELPLDGDPVGILSDYDIVIWTIGDRDTNNLTAANIAQLLPYLDAGGRLLYSGGHNVYSESATGAATLIGTYLGLASYTLHMPTIQNNAAPVPTTGQGHPTVGTTTYNFWYWPGGAYGTMFSGFYLGQPTAVGLLDHQPTNLNNSGAPDYNGFLATANAAGPYRTITWGFDINHVDPGDRTLLLGNALAFLAQ